LIERSCTPRPPAPLWAGWRSSTPPDQGGNATNLNRCASPGAKASCVSLGNLVKCAKDRSSRGRYARDKRGLATGVTTTFIRIQLLSGFGPAHERAVIDYLAGRLAGREAWAIAFEAFDLLDQAVLIIDKERHTFRALYQRMVDRRMVDPYLSELLLLHDVKQQSPALWSRFARQIVGEFTQRGWRRSDMPETRLLLSYLLYCRGRAHTLVVLLQSSAWNIIDGDTVPGRLDTVVEQLPAPVRIRHRGRELVVVEYDEWKRRILRLQGETQ